MISAFRSLAIAGTVFLAACTTPYSTDDPALIALHGSPAEVAHGETGARYARFVSPPEVPEDLASGYAVAGDPRGLFVMDIALLFREEAGVPLYKMRLLPRNYTPEILAALPETIEGGLRKRDGGTLYPIAARLPADRTLDANGTLETDWTLCTSCLGFDDAQGSLTQQQTAEYFLSFAGTPAADQTFITLDYTRAPTHTLVTGAAADSALGRYRVARAEQVQQRNAREAETAATDRRYGPARDAYRDFVESYPGFGLAARRTKECGTLRLRDAPRILDGLDETFDDLEREIDRNKTAYETYANCVEEVAQAAADPLDPAERRALVQREEALWKASDIDGADRIRVLTLNDATAAEYTALAEQTARYNAILRNYDEAWNEAVEIAEEDAEYQREQSNRRVASRNSAQRDRIVQECVAFAMANNAFTPNTLSYCEGDPTDVREGLYMITIRGEGDIAALRAAYGADRLTGDTPRVSGSSATGTMDRMWSILSTRQTGGFQQYHKNGGDARRVCNPSGPGER